MEGRRGKRGGGATDADATKVSPKAGGRTSSPVSKSPSRRSPVRTRSPARNRSPGRKSSPTPKTPSRKTSPARTRSPARNKPRARSTSRPQSTTTTRRSARNKNDVNDVLTEGDEVRDSPAKQAAKTRLSPLKGDAKSVKVSTTKLSSTTTTSSIKVTNHTNEGDDEVARLTAKYLQTATDKLSNNLTPSASELSKRSYSRSVSRSVLDDEEWSHSDHSDRNDDLYANRITRSRSKTTASYLHRREQNIASDAAAEFGGRFGATILAVLVALLCVSLQYICSRPDCSCKALRTEKLAEISTYFSLEAGLIYVGYAWLIYLLSAIPYIGHRKKLPPSTTTEVEHYFNGIASAILVLVVLGVTEYCYKYPILALIYKNYQQLCIVSILYAIIISVWCFCRSAYIPNALWNPFGKSGRILGDLFIGREINPRWFNVIDIKLVHLRMSLITTLVLNSIFLIRNVKFAALPIAKNANESLGITNTCLHIIQNARYDAVAAITAILIIVYVLDILIFEHHLTSSFELQCEGVGSQILLRYAVFPIWTSLISKYALQNKIVGVPQWALATISVVFLAGIILKRLSNELKYHYRINPTSKRSTNLDTLPTFQGRRLIIGKYWSLVRHPNYVGEILCSVALLPLLYFRFAWPPLVAALYTIALLVHRARRVDNRMFQHYNSAWARYKAQIRYSFLPKIY